MLIGFIMVALCVSAQPKLSKSFKTSTTKPYQVVDAQMKQYFTDNKGFSYSIKTSGDDVTLQKFDILSMKEVVRKEYHDGPPYNKAIDVVEIGDKFFYLYESFNKKEETKSVYVREFFTEDCSLGQERMLLTSDGDVANGPITESIGVWGMKGGPPFSVYKSFDDSKIMINYRRKPLLKNGSENKDLLGFFVFDSSLEPIWGREIEMPYTEQEMNNLAYTVSTDGTVYMMSLHRMKKNFRLLTIPEVGKLTVKIIDSENFMFKHLYMAENKDGQLDFLGFYANGLEYKFWEGSIGNLSFNTNGIRYFKLSKEGEILANKDIEFPIELINKYESGRQQDKNEKRESVGKAGIRDVVLRKFTVNPDGSVFILGEQYYYSQKLNPKNYQMTYKFHYGDLVAAKLNAKGEVQWMKKLPKNQFGTQGKGGMGIAYLEGDDSHYILFLDNVKNADIEPDESPASHFDGKGGYLTAYKIDDATGNYTKHTLYNSVEVKGVKTYQFATTRIFEAMDNVLLVEVYIKDKKDMMIKMELVN
ncbi:MAG: hypothetical protein A2W85_07305 [Bacteroidetes bacterium GWF2_41_31]|nr:MAG: hypothetical protein A2W85_07305 [Bacteroidetes bacterium GWF2_41_31]OFZ02693.1 MAG: hypothetical protein A2338_01690 [Bacteroidetes bacterium RIFOXYB12_FULL_41_6]